MTQNANLTTTVDIHDLPIFEAGSYPQGNFNIDMLQTLADAYDPSFHEAPVYLAHEDAVGQRPASPLAFGWVRRLYTKGQTLFADLSQVPKAFADLILAGRIKKRSVEIYPDLAGNGPYLRALAWPLIPEVKGLADLHPTQIFSETDPNRFLSLSYVGAELALPSVSSDESITFQEKESPMPEPDPITRDEIKLMFEAMKSELLAEIKSAQSANEVKTFCEQMVLAGKMTPAERATEEPLLIAQRNRESALTFAESEQTLSVQRMNYYRNRSTVLPLNQPSAASSDKPENQKLIAYFNENRAYFEKMNVTLDDLIAADHGSQKNPLTN
jgi:hypothetical protein